MEQKSEIAIQILHFNDCYDIEKTPLFTSSLLMRKSIFLQNETPGMLNNGLLFRKTIDFTFKHKKYFPDDMKR